MNKSVEAKRGCGFRKVDGLYMMAGTLMRICHHLPIPLTSCRGCGHGIKMTRGFRWVIPAQLWPLCDYSAPMSVILTNAGVAIEGQPDDSHGCAVHYEEDGHAECVACQPSRLERAGLMWVGSKYYTPASFSKEAAVLGVSKRIPAIPRGFKVGEDWVFLAHAKALPDEKERRGWLTNVLEKLGDAPLAGAIFTAIRPTHFELLKKEGELSKDEIAELWEKKRIKVIEIPETATEHFK